MRISQQKKLLVQRALSYMNELFFDYPLTELEYETPFQLLVAVMLSAQTTDKQVNQVTKNLFREVQTPEDVLRLGTWGVGEAIKTVGLWKGKTINMVKMAGSLMKHKEWNMKHIMENMIVGADTICPPHDHSSSVKQKDIRAQQRQYANARELYKERWYWIPDTLEEMIQLPWVGIKTAKVVLYILYGQRRVAVDTHVHRVMNRLWIVYTKTPEQSSVLLEQIIPDEMKDIAHRVIIYFWRYHCMAKNPQCDRCALRDVCKRYKKHH